MKIKFKLSLMMIAIMVLAMTGIAVILLRQASKISVDLSERSLRNMALARANFWKGREDGHLQILRGLASIMGQYEPMPVDERRNRYDEMLLATLVNNTNFIRIFSIWKPNVLDGMDS